MAKLPNTAHLKVGNHYPDPVHTAKIQGTHFEGTASEVHITPTPDSKPSANDLDNPRGFASINPAAKPNTYTGPGGSKRD